VLNQTPTMATSGEATVITTSAVTSSGPADANGNTHNRGIDAYHRQRGKTHLALEQC
jgi:hypothetical protein